MSDFHSFSSISFPGSEYSLPWVRNQIPSVFCWKPRNPITPRVKSRPSHVAGDTCRTGSYPLRLLPPSRCFPRSGYSGLAPWERDQALSSLGAFAQIRISLPPHRSDNTLWEHVSWSSHRPCPPSSVCCAVVLHSVICRAPITLWIGLIISLFLCLLSVFPTRM